jgi:hypothetical protein
MTTFPWCLFGIIKEEIPEESVMNHYFDMVNPSDCVLFALFQQDYRGYKSQKYPTLSLLQRRCVIREAVSIATVRVMNNRKQQKSRYHVTLIDIEMAIDKVVALMNKNKTNESTADDTNENPDTTQESNSSDDKEKQLPTKKMYCDSTKDIVDLFHKRLDQYKFLEFAKTGLLRN